MILSMLQEGKITSEEAVKLIEALEDLENPNTKSESESTYAKFNKEHNRTSKVLNKTLDEIGSDISSAFSNIFSGLKDLGSSININSNSTTHSVDLEKDLSEVECPILDFRAINGSINLRQSSSQTIRMKVNIQYKNEIVDPNNELYKFYIDGNRVIFTPIYNNDISIKLDVAIPNRKYDKIILNSTNGKIFVQDLNTNLLNIDTTNGSIVIEDIASNDINLSTKNGKIDCVDIKSNIIKLATTNSSIDISDIQSTNIEAITANSKINVSNINSNTIICRTSNNTVDARDISAESIILTTSNGKIVISDIDFAKAKDVRLLTSNGSINSEIHDLSKEAYIDLETSMGNINLEIPNLVYTTNKQINLGIKKIIAHSINYDENQEHLNFIASTSNGSIKIS